MSLRQRYEHRNGNNTRIGRCVHNGAGGVNQLRRTDPQAAAAFVRWQLGQDPEAECPGCTHYADNHAITGCLVNGCRCPIGIAPRSYGG